MLLKFLAGTAPAGRTATTQGPPGHPFIAPRPPSVDGTRQKQVRCNGIASHGIVWHRVTWGADAVPENRTALRGGPSG